jgi:WD40 repeat protein
VQSGAQKQVITDNASLGIYWIALLPDTDGGVKYILTGNKDNTARLWDGHTGSLVRTFAGHTDQLWGVTFSPDGKYVLTASQDKTARLWDTATGNLIRILGGHKDVVLDVSFSPDGKTILTASQDKTAALWDVDYHDLVRFVCARVLRDFNPEERAYYHIDSNAHTCP